jgi:hypothetical protein
MLKAGFADFGSFRESGVREKNGLERVKTGFFWQPSQ